MSFPRLTLRRTISADGPRPADDVWDRYLRPQRWPEWSPQIRMVEYAGEVLRAGSSGVVHGPCGVRVRFRITAVDDSGPLRQWSWSVWTAGGELDLAHTVEPVSAGTRTALTVTGLGPVVLLYLPIAGVALRRLVR